MKKYISILLCLAFFISLSFPVYATAYTDTVVKGYDQTAIEEDLAGIDLSTYSKNPFGECSIMSMMEYCFSFNSQCAREYGLYVYIYNPSGEPLERNNNLNSVSMVVEYSDLTELETDTYDPGIDTGKGRIEKCPLIYLDHTSDYLFYKFKINLPTDFLEHMQTFAEARGGSRRYEITELEVKKEGENIQAFSDHVYVWQGFAAYCGSDSSAVSTLSCKNYGTRSIHLKLDHTNYRGGYDGRVCDDLNTAIFTIPESYFQEFGNLNSVKTQWYEYVTSPMFVTSDADAYRALWDMRNIRINEFGQQIDTDGNVLSSIELSYSRVLWESVLSENIMSEFKFDKAYNPKCRDDVAPFPQKGDLGETIDLGDNWTCESMVTWLFYVANITGADAYCVDKDTVKDYMRKYSNDFSDDLIRGKYATNLFAEDKGLQTIKLEDQDFQSFIGNSSSQSWWNRFWNGKTYDSLEYDPIVIVKESDLILSSEEFSELYLVNVNDAPSIIEQAREAFDQNERMVLLRFAVRDYYASSAVFDYVEDSETQDVFDAGGGVYDGYVARETVFLDFDVISLGFKEEDGADETIIGVVADPIDIINGLTPPEGLVTEQEWWQKLMAVLLLILIVVILSFCFPFITTIFKILLDGVLFIVKLLFSIVGLPLRLLSRLFSRRR